MSTRTTVVLLAVLAGLGATALFVQGPGRADRSRTRAAVFPGLAAKDVALIRASGDGVDLLLTREVGGWRLGAAKETADAAAVEALLAGLVALREGPVVSTNIARQSGYGTDAGQGIAVHLEGAGGKPIGGFVVGKRGPDLASCYLRRDGKSDVLLVSRDLRADFSRPADSWKESPKKP